MAVKALRPLECRVINTETGFARSETGASASTGVGLIICVGAHILQRVSAITKKVVVGAGDLRNSGCPSLRGIGPSDNQLDASVAHWVV